MSKERSTKIVNMKLLAGVLVLGIAKMVIKQIYIDLSLSFHRTNKLNEMIMSKEASIITSAFLGMAMRWWRRLEWFFVKVSKSKADKKDC